MDMNLKALLKGSNWRGESFYFIWWRIILLYLICLNGIFQRYAYFENNKVGQIINNGEFAIRITALMELILFECFIL